jgi:hypothetical protein
MPAHVGHVLYRLTDQLVQRGPHGLSLLDVERGSDGNALGLSVWRWDWATAFQNAKGESTIPEVLGTPPELPFT